MMEEYVNGDSDLAVCVDVHGENWEENLLGQIGQIGPEQQEAENEDDKMNDDPLLRECKLMRM